MFFTVVWWAMSMSRVVVRNVKFDCKKYETWIGKAIFGMIVHLKFCLLYFALLVVSTKVSCYCSMLMLVHVRKYAGLWNLWGCSTLLRSKWSSQNSTVVAPMTLSQSIALCFWHLQLKLRYLSTFAYCMGRSSVAWAWRATAKVALDLLNKFCQS